SGREDSSGNALGIRSRLALMLRSMFHRKPATEPTANTTRKRMAPSANVNGCQRRAADVLPELDWFEVDRAFTGPPYVAMPRRRHVSAPTEGRVGPHTDSLSVLQRRVRRGPANLPGVDLLD